MDAELRDIGDFESWSTAAVTRVPVAEARTVPYFQTADRAYKVWWSHSPGTMPNRRQLDPILFGAGLLPRLTLMDVIGDGADYSWRLCGEQATEIMGRPLTGRTLTEIEADLGDTTLFRLALDDVVESTEPLFYVLRHRTQSGCMKRSYGVLLPLAGDTATPANAPAPVAHILGACDWANGD
jgi:hypothetical protein